MSTATTDFTVQPNDPAAIRDALTLTFNGLEHYIKNHECEDLYEYIVAQRNGDRILKRFCDEIADCGIWDG